MRRPPLAEGETELDDIWANEGGVSVRLIRRADGHLRIEFTRGVNEPTEHAATLTPHRARRLAEAIQRGQGEPQP